MKTIKKLIENDGLYFKEYEDGESEVLNEIEFDELYAKWEKRPNTRKYDKNGVTVFEFNVPVPPPPAGL